MADALGGLLGGGLHVMDDHNPAANWVAQSWLIWHHRAIFVVNYVRNHNDEEGTFQNLDFLWSHATIHGP
jgi:hypothetical protein